MRPWPRLGCLTLEDRLAPAALDLHDDIHRVATLPSTTITLTGTAELHVTGSGDPFVGSIVNLNSPDAWLFLDNVLPSTVTASMLSRVKVNDAAAVLNTNVRVVQYGQGAVVIPHSATFAPLTVFTDANFGGTTTALNQYTAYTSASLGAFSGTISSFKLKRGYTATFATTDTGTGISKNYVAQDGDLIVPVMPGGLDNAVTFIRVFPWRWTTKKGIAGNIGQQLDIQWKYNWNISENSTLDREYVPIRQTRWWPDLNQNWQTRGANTLLGYNEPDQASQANLTVAQAVSFWPDLLGTGLRVGAPAVSDGGLSWLYSFISQAEAEGKRVDFVPVHYYRSHNPADPAGAATQFYNFLKGIYDTVKRPIWVTEWNNGANWTSDADPTYAQQQACVAAMVNMLETTPFVERYALYNWVEDVRRVQWDDATGSLTLAGETYRDTVSTLSYRQELPDPLTTPTATYSFDGTTLDQSGNGQPALPVGTRTFVPGMQGQALEFDGQNDYVQVSPRLGDSTDFTFATWVKWDGGAGWQRIMDLGWDTNKYLFLTPKAGSTGPLRFAIKNGGSEQQLNAATALTPNVWTHVAVTISGSTGKLFVNGEVVATNTAMTINPVDLGAFYNYLGKSRFTADPLFAGALDDVRFVNSALTEAQVAALALKVQDFGFESPSTTTFAYNPAGAAWTYSGASGNGSGVTTNASAFTSGNAVAPQGTQVGFLQGTGSITQTVSGFEPGRSYTFSFAASQRQNKAGGQAGETFDLRLDGTTLGSFAPTQSVSTYTDFTRTFTATAGAHTFSFVGTNLNGGDNTAFLDRIRIRAADPTTPTPTLALQAGSFRNAGFEESPSSVGWTRTGSAALVNSSFRSGARGIQMNGVTGTAEQIVTGLLPNTTYTLTAWARVSFALAEARLGVKNHGATEQFASTTNTDFTRLSLTFTTGPASTSATIYLSKPTNNYAADFDDLSLVEADPTVGTFSNAGFEETPAGTGWTLFGTAAVVSTNQRSGSRALRMNGGTGRGEQIVTGLQPNTIYALSAWARGSTGTTAARIGAKNFGGTETWVDLTGTAYAPGTVVFTTGAASTTATIYLSKPGSSNATDFDDVTLVAVPRSTNEDTAIAPPLQFFLNDATLWNITATSSNPALVTDAKLVVSTTGFRRTLQVTPEANQSGTTAITLTATDTFGGTATYTFPFTVLPVNDAPLLDTTGTMTLPTINQDTTSPTGTTVSALIASAAGNPITDVDPSPLEGIAVTTIDATNGTWQYSLNNGSNWTNFGTPTPTAARLLASDATTRIRFVPAAAYFGTAVIAFRAWDQTTGTNGSTANTSTNGGTTAFSTTIESAAITVNGRPTATPQALIVPMTLPTALTLTGSDPENQPLTFTVTVPPANGTLSGTAPNLIYTPAPGYFGPDSFQYTASDGLALSTAATVALTVVAPPTTVSLVTINAGDPQRSRITSVQLNFAIPLNAAQLAGTGAITLTRTSGGPPITLTTGNGLSIAPLSGTVSSLMLTFSGSVGVENGSLADGRWQLAIPYLQYSSPLNSTDLRRLFGDANLDGTVDGSDLTAFGNAFGSTTTAFDADDNGTIDGTDLTAFGNRFGMTI